MINRVLRAFVVSLVVLLGLPVVGCSGPSSYSGNCNGVSYYADGSTTTISGSGYSLRASSSTLAAQVRSGQNVTLRGSGGRTYSIPLSASARNAMQNNNDPCPAVDEIMQWLANQKNPNGTNGGTNGGTGTGTGTGGGTGTGTANGGGTSNSSPGSSGNVTVGGSLVLYVGSFSAQDIRSANVTLARQAGDDPSLPAMFSFRGLSLDGCTVTLPPGQTVIYLDGDLSVKSTTFASASSSAASAADARNFLLLGTTNCANLSFSGCTQQVTAGIYAPSAAVTLDGTTLFGGVVGCTVQCSSSNVTYDPHLKVLNYEGFGIATSRWSQEMVQQ